MSSLYIDGTFRISQEILKLRHIKVKSRADARLFVFYVEDSIFLGKCGRPRRYIGKTLECFFTFLNLS